MAGVKAVLNWKIARFWPAVVKVNSNVETNGEKGLYYSSTYIHYINAEQRLSALVKPSLYHTKTMRFSHVKIDKIYPNNYTETEYSHHAKAESRPTNVAGRAPHVLDIPNIGVQG